MTLKTRSYIFWGFLLVLIMGMAMVGCGGDSTNEPAIIVYGALGDLVENHQDGQIDANSFASGIPVAGVLNYEANVGTENVVFFGIDGEAREKVMEKYPYWTPGVIPADTYGFLDEDVETINVFNWAIVHKDLPNSLVYEIVDAVMTNNPDMLVVHSAAAETLPEFVNTNTFLPLHPGAYQWFVDHGYAVDEGAKPTDDGHDDPWPTTISLGTAGTGGVYATYGAGWANIVQEHVDIGVNVEQTGGPADNMMLVNDKANDMGMITMGIGWEGWTGAENTAFAGDPHTNVRALFPMYSTFSQWWAHKDSGITNIYDLAGKRVGVGPTGGTPGTYHPLILELLGM